MRGAGRHSTLWLCIASFTSGSFGSSQSGSSAYDKVSLCFLSWLRPWALSGAIPGHLTWAPSQAPAEALLSVFTGDLVLALAIVLPEDVVGFTSSSAQGFTMSSIGRLASRITNGFTRDSIRGSTRGFTREFTEGLSKGCPKGFNNEFSNGSTKSFARAVKHISPRPLAGAPQTLCSSGEPLLKLGGTPC